MEGKLRDVCDLSDVVFTHGKVLELVKREILVVRRVAIGVVRMDVGRNMLEVRSLWAIIVVGGVGLVTIIWHRRVAFLGFLVGLRVAFLEDVVDETLALIESAMKGLAIRRSEVVPHVLLKEIRANGRMLLGVEGCRTKRVGRGTTLGATKGFAVLLGRSWRRKGLVERSRRRHRGRWVMILLGRLGLGFLVARCRDTTGSRLIVEAMVFLGKACDVVKTDVLRLRSRRFRVPGHGIRVVSMRMLLVGTRARTEERDGMRDGGSEDRRTFKGRSFGDRSYHVRKRFVKVSKGFHTSRYLALR